MLAQVAVDGRWLIVVDGDDRAERVVQGLRFFHSDPQRVVELPADDVRPYDGFSPDPSVIAERIATWAAIDGGGPLIVVAPVAGLATRIPGRNEREKSRRTVKKGDRLDRDTLARWLQSRGFLAVARVEEPGQFAVRGDVLDLWRIDGPPVRIDFFDDEIEELRRLDAVTQRTGAKLAEVAILPAREEILDDTTVERASQEFGRLVAEHGRGTGIRRRVFEDLRAGIRFAGIEAWLPALLPTDSPWEELKSFRLVVVYPEDVSNAIRDFERTSQERWEALDEEDRPLVPPKERFLSSEEVLRTLEGAHPVWELPEHAQSVDFGVRSLDGFAVKGGDLAPVVSKIKDLARKKVRVGLVAEQGPRAQQLLEMLAHHELEPTATRGINDLKPGQVGWFSGDLRNGFVAESAGWAFIPAAALFGEKKHTRKMSQAHAFFDAAVTNLSELREGDLVVHRLHGIGEYKGLTRVPIRLDATRSDWDARIAAGMVGTQTDRDVVEQDFVRIEYRDGDLLLLPVTRLEVLSKYRGASEGGTTKLDKLGGSTWAARREKVRDAVLKMAQELLAIYAKRELAERPPYGRPGRMYEAFEHQFPYDETRDQLVAIEAIHEDLLRENPMDRLLCGDVGYGKTEVAMRAAMRAVEAGRQVAVLCPTTVLAFQHAQTFKERFAGFPITIDLLSRFRSASEEKDVLSRMKSGGLDIVIGTTKLFGRDIQYKRLGLVVIDEEHRFGVKQKERLKKLRAEVDVLSMSATPIPRTLQMAMSGMRPMSVMATPPRDRLAVRTTVSKFSESRIREGILLELERQGQVFFVHNRVEDIEHIAHQLAEWVPEARYAVAHGQMEPEDLEEVLIDFIDRKIDVLVASAIIESGVDLPNVNTMFVNRAERFGLAQLYQLRGRVGRGSTRGNCILLVPEGLNPEAKRRIRTLVENADLGAGFRIAMADLEMRGAGNLLGDSQSGHIDAVGYDTWVELLEAAVHEARGDMERQRIDPEVEVPVKAFLSESMFPDVAERLGWYRRLSSSLTEPEVDDWVSEMEVRFGELPEEVANLAGMARTRVLCRDAGIIRCQWLKVRVLLQWHGSANVPVATLKALVAGSPKRFALREKEGAWEMDVRFLPQEAEKPFRFLRWVFAQLRRSET